MTAERQYSKSPNLNIFADGLLLDSSDRLIYKRTSFPARLLL
jgi:hypothetical protein